MDHIKFIIITDKPKLFKDQDDRLIVTPRDFITNTEKFAGFKRAPKISRVVVIQ